MWIFDILYDAKTWFPTKQPVSLWDIGISSALWIGRRVPSAWSKIVGQHSIPRYAEVCIKFGSVVTYRILVNRILGQLT